MNRCQSNANQIESEMLLQERMQAGSRVYAVDGHLWSGIPRIKVDSRRYEVDLCDWLHHSLTTCMFLVSALLVSARQYLGKPISCWVPTEFTRSQEEYAEAACWVTSTYFVANVSKSGVSRDSVRRSQHKLSYYQWVPFALMAQATMFYFPWLIWRVFNWRSGYPVSRISELSRHLQLPLDRIERRQHIILLAATLTDVVRSPFIIPDNKTASGNTSTTATTNTSSSTACTRLCARLKQQMRQIFCFWSRSGYYMSLLYFGIKLLFLINSVAQLLLINVFLSQSTQYSSFFGLLLLQDIIEGRTWRESGRFPRITFCDFTVLKLANSHTHTIQCVLPINMLNEKVYIFIWFWILLLSIKTTESLLVRFFQLIIPGKRYQFVANLLKFRNAFASHEKSDLSNFVYRHLRSDGVFILRLIKSLSGEVACSELVTEMWNIYVAPHRHSNTIDTTANLTNDDHKQILFKQTAAQSSSIGLAPIQSTFCGSKAQKSKKRFSFKNLTKQSSLPSSNEPEEGDFV